MSLQTIPEVELLDKINGRDLLQLCQTNRYYRNLCSNDGVWEYKLGQEYPDYLDLKPDGMTFRHYYLLLDASSPFIIASADGVDYVPDRLIDYQWIWEYLYHRYHNFVGVMMKGKEVLDIIADDGYIPDEDGTEEENLRQADLILVLQGDQKPVSIKTTLNPGNTIITQSCYNANKRNVHRYLIEQGIVFHPEVDGIFSRDDMCGMISILRRINMIEG